MRNNINNNPMYQRIMKRAKRIVITVLCCLPILILFGYFTRNIITSQVAQIAIYVVIMLVAVIIEELVTKRKEQNKTEVEDVDVFK